jgi:hypothetical protein
MKPSHYDDDGYVVQWFRSSMRSNSLAAVYGLAMDCAAQKVLGPQTGIVVDAYDETNTRIWPERIARDITEAGGGMVGLVGVQSNQYPRALDLARPFRALGINVVIGGFHVSGTLAMLPAITPELQEAIDLGVALYAGEAEDGLAELLRDAADEKLRPIYNHMSSLPNLAGVPLPYLPSERVARTAGRMTTFDAGRGCPFQCSFCTIINVQGRVSRHRTSEWEQTYWAAWRTYYSFAHTCTLMRRAAAKRISLGKNAQHAAELLGAEPGRAHASAGRWLSPPQGALRAATGSANRIAMVASGRGSCPT